MVRLLHQGYDQTIDMEPYHASRWPRHLGKHSREFATSISLVATPASPSVFRRLRVMPPVPSSDPLSRRRLITAVSPHSEASPPLHEE
jgi:hypothetical protein